jgi:nucleotide-binding universal stress UspA family protein
MFNKILVAYDESPESGRALLTGIHLAKSLNAELKAVSVQENLPPYAGYIDAEVPGGTILLRQQAADYYRVELSCTTLLLLISLMRGSARRATTLAECCYGSGYPSRE